MFLEDMKIIERSYTFEEKRSESQLPALANIILEKESDFAQFAEILAVIFRERIAEVKFKEMTGEYIPGKDFYRLILKSPEVFKEKFNTSCLSLGNRRVILF